MSTQGDANRARSVLQKGIHEEPSHLETRQLLASVSVSQGQEGVAQALLSKFFETSPVYNEASLHDALRLLSISCKSQPTLARKIAQRAVALAPWDARNWWCISYIQKSGRDAHM